MFKLSFRNSDHNNKHCEEN